jgi:esterase/lipase
MNWDFAMQLAKVYSKEFASDHGKNQEDSAIYCARYNGYHAGYMRDCAERESLRAIVKRLEGTNAPVLITQSQIDDLI